MFEVRERRIRSYVRRQGRTTAAQRKALERLWNRYVLNTDRMFDHLTIFSRAAPLIVEVGFGNGDALASLALANPQLDYLGIEVHRPGIGRLLGQLEALDIHNVRVYCDDAVNVLKSNIPDTSLTGLHLFFPDPWPKKRHKKRRLMTPGFVELVCQKLIPSGYLHAATDWEDYAYQMLSVLNECRSLQNAAATDRFVERPAHRPLTKFEIKGQRLGHKVWDLIFFKAHYPC
jgi:tRNA (guanine-N7-)-methyltransferase